MKAKSKVRWWIGAVLFLLGMVVVGIISWRLLRWIERRAEKEP